MFGDNKISLVSALKQRQRLFSEEEKKKTINRKAPAIREENGEGFKFVLEDCPFHSFQVHNLKCIYTLAVQFMNSIQEKKLSPTLFSVRLNSEY